MQIEQFPNQPSALGQFILGKSILGYEQVAALTGVVPVYLYQQYSDDADLQAFFAALNAKLQGYIDWANQTPLGVYTNANISGPLLDWIGRGVYNIARPVVSTLTSRSIGAYATAPYLSTFYEGRTKYSSGQAQLANDDIYKRVLTWHTYLGDGRQMSLMWLKKRVARFLYGTNGSDVLPDVLPNVSIAPKPINISASNAVGAYATQAYITQRRKSRAAANALQITIPPGVISTQFQALFQQGYLASPFQVKFNVVIQS